MSIWKGAASVGPLTTGIRYSPGSGDSWVREWTGSEVSMKSIQLAIRRARSDVDVEATHVDGPVWKCRAVFPFATDSTLYNSFEIEWSTRTELVEKDLFDLPKVAVESAAFGDGKAAFKKQITEAVGEGTDFSAIVDGPTGPAAAGVYTELSRGVTGYETEYQIVTRVRRAHRSAQFDRQIFTAKLIYSTSQLNIPPSIKFSFQAPTEADTADRVWGWRLRDQEFRLVGDRQEEIITWAGTYWSTFIYDISTEIYS